MTECSECGSSEVETEIVLEAEGKNVYSRHPFRVLSCQQCGHEEKHDPVRPEGEE